MILVQGATATMRALRGTQNLGILMSPQAHNNVQSLIALGFPMACDNGAFSGFDADAFLGMLDRLSGSRMMWVTAADVVGQWLPTINLFDIWEPIIRSAGHPVALMAQDGLKASHVPWNRLDCLFIGGTDEWKFSDAAVSLCEAATSRGKMLHIGRCNSYTRIRAAMAINADSVDGSQFSWWPDKYIPLGMRWIERAARELSDQRWFNCSRQDALTAARRKSRPGPLGCPRSHARRKINSEPLFTEALA